MKNRNSCIPLLILVVFAVSGCIVKPGPGVYRGGPPAEAYAGGPPAEVYAEEVAAPPIVYGEPCYYTPPIVVAYPYDYFTYENVGGYVNVVFWRGGHRIHTERNWNHGRFMSVEHMRDWHRNYRVRSSELAHHRHQLESVHHISRPDAYYGVRRGPDRHVEENAHRPNQSRQQSQFRPATQSNHQPGQQARPPEMQQQQRSQRAQESRQQRQTQTQAPRQQRQSQTQVPRQQRQTQTQAPRQQRQTQTQAPRQQQQTQAQAPRIQQPQQHQQKKQKKDEDNK